jgi:hypothetical protein
MRSTSPVWMIFFTDSSGQQWLKLQNLVCNYLDQLTRDLLLLSNSLQSTTSTFSFTTSHATSTYKASSLLSMLWSLFHRGTKSSSLSQDGGAPAAILSPNEVSALAEIRNFWQNLQLRMWAVQSM